MCGRRQDLLRYFIEIQLSAALDGSDMQGPARPIVQNVVALARHFGVRAGTSRGAAARCSAASGPRRRNPATPWPTRMKCCRSPRRASDDEVIKAYRRQMSRNHPDKLVANGLPESMQELAKQKTQRIREAYETIRTHRNMK